MYYLVEEQHCKVWMCAPVSMAVFLLKYLSGKHKYVTFALKDELVQISPLSPVSS